MARDKSPIPLRPETRAANKRKGQRKGGSVRGGQLAAIKQIRRVVIESFLFDPQSEGEMPDYWRRHPQGEQAVRWLVEFFERLSQEQLQYPLRVASEVTVQKDTTAILAKRKLDKKAV
jgi:hypothetical protein